MKIPESVEGANGKQCKRLGTGHSCSCCAATDNGKDWFVFRAGWCDEDGVFYPRLCGGFNGEGCISEVEPADTEKNRLAQELLKIMPEEADDGIVSELEDFDYLFGG